ncbi:MAG: hypothetical protein QOH55_622 [Microbacteriaceae bacterium]|jgi:peptidoglycan/LPS O-acetylase OafA/YrhL|nr:hypothetical protein [Microbacteriaceae bacterium]
MTFATHARTGGTALSVVPRPAAQRRFAGLDGLRAIAVTAVILYHFFPRLLPGGFIGVDVFFVISGFLITSLLVAERTSTGRISLRGFWQRRIRRLVPALVVLVLASCTAAWIIGGDVLVGLARQVLGAATFSSNWLDIASNSSYFSRDTPELFRTLWSLAVEEQFYLVWPLILLALFLLRSPAVRVALIGLLAVASGAEMAWLFTPGADATRVYFGSDTHSFGLAIGAVLALIVSRLTPVDLDAGETWMQVFVRRWLPGVGGVSLGALVVAAWWLHDDATLTYRGGLVVVSILTACVVWAAVSPGSSLGRLLDAAPLRAIGVRSYGLYLWHWPVLTLILGAGPALRTPAVAWLAGVPALVITAVAALLSYRFVEQPIRKQGLRATGLLLASRIRVAGRWRRSGIAVAALAALCCAPTVAALVTAPTVTTAQSFIQRGQAAIAAHAAAHSAAPSRASTHSSPSPTPTAPNRRPLPTGQQITAIGDSVMLASAPSLEQTFPGIAIDAVVSRQMYVAPAIVQSLKDAGALRSCVLIGLGTNGSISPDTLAQLKQIVGPTRELVFVTVQAPRGWTDGVNATLTAFAASNPRSVALAQWQSAIAPHLDLLAGDHIHPGTSGGRIYASAVMAALVQLSGPPPFRPYSVWELNGSTR